MLKQYAGNAWIWTKVQTCDSKGANCKTWSTTKTCMSSQKTDCSNTAKATVRFGQTPSPTRYPTKAVTLKFSHNYFVAPRGDNDCGANGQYIKNKDECMAAAKALGTVAANGRTWAGSSANLPPYCSYQSGGDNAAHYNAAANGKKRFRIFADLYLQGQKCHNR